MGVCLQCLGCLSAAGLHLIYAVDCLGTRLESLFQEMPHRGKKTPPITIYSRHASAAASLFSRHAERIAEFSQFSKSSVASPVHYCAFVPMRGSHVCDNRMAFRSPYRRTHAFQTPSRSSESPTEPEPTRTQRTTMARRPGVGLCSALARFSDACMCEASGVQRPPQKIQENAPDSGIFSFPSGSFPDSRAPGKKEPAEAAGALEASARAEVGRLSTGPHTAAAPSAWACCSTPAPRRHAAAAPRVASAGFGGGGGGVQASRARRASKDVESRVFLVSHTESRALEFRIAGSQIPSNGLCRHVLLPSEQFFSWAYVHFIV